MSIIILLWFEQSKLSMQIVCVAPAPAQGWIFFLPVSFLCAFTCTQNFLCFFKHIFQALLICT